MVSEERLNSVAFDKYASTQVETYLQQTVETIVSERSVKMEL